LPFGYLGKIHGAVLPYARPVISALAASTAGTADPPVNSMTGNAGNGYTSHISNSNSTRGHHLG
jgi:hypothetical protein